MSIFTEKIPGLVESGLNTLFERSTALDRARNNVKYVVETVMKADEIDAPAAAPELMGRVAADAQTRPFNVVTDSTLQTAEAQVDTPVSDEAARHQAEMAAREQIEASFNQPNASFEQSSTQTVVDTRPVQTLTPEQSEREAAIKQLVDQAYLN